MGVVWITRCSFSKFTNPLLGIWTLGRFWASSLRPELLIPFVVWKTTSRFFQGLSHRSAVGRLHLICSSAGTLTPLTSSQFFRNQLINLARVTREVHRRRPSTRCDDAPAAHWWFASSLGYAPQSKSSTRGVNADKLHSSSIPFPSQVASDSVKFQLLRS